MEYRKAHGRTVAACGTSADDATRFLRELRQLRNGAGLGQAELAARAHYPYDRIMAAEVGPALPDLPVLSAYVRGCGGTTEEWEERWRSLTRTPSLPVPATRRVGESLAATAGARICSATLDTDAPDPSIILAALNRVAEGMAGACPPGETAEPAIPAQVSSASPAAASGMAPAPAPVLAADVPGPVPPESAPVAETPVPPVSAPAPAVPAAEPPRADIPGGGKPTGWDPIRVSSAWPALGSAAASRSGAGPVADGT
ncbi:MAG TPA: helix-turn-helix domain-containing protein, partial [Trebonia sp.]|nr:helix-turn-helix domain-containing protein [Trebonia sp.]